MALPTKINICSTASVLIGAAPIQSFDEGTIESEVAQSLYESLYENLLRHRHWTFAREYFTPQLLAQKSELGYKYVYHIPNTILLIEDIGGHDFKLQLNKLHTDAKNPLVNGRIKPAEAVLPADFVLALTYLIASEMSVPVTENTTKAQFYEQKASAQVLRAVDNDLAQEPEQIFDIDPLYYSRY